MKHWKLALCAAVASLGMASAAYAEDAAAPTLAFNFGIANEYSFRGLSQTRKDIQVFGGADLTYGKFYAGTWISNIDFG
ncbi:MAG TPA: TorF family putative porin, partial [Caulobacteraceae bacterium]|nr:TorF family putative porin [Caulobacteraceae bacterium]